MRWLMRWLLRLPIVHLIGDLVADLIFDLMHFFGSAAGIWILSTITPLSLFAVYENERV